MVVELRYFASVREILGLDGERLELAEGDWTVAGLQAYLAARGGVWAEVFDGGRKTLCAVEQCMARATTPIPEGAEVAFFPPVTGG